MPSNNGRGLGSLTDFNCFIIISVLSSVLYLVKRMGWLRLYKGEARLFYRAVRLSRISFRVLCTLGLKTINLLISYKGTNLLIYTYNIVIIFNF